MTGFGGKSMNIRLIRQKLQTALPMLGFTVLYLWAFIHLEKMYFIKSYEIHSSLDQMIPFCEYFVIPYIAWFAMVPAVCIFLLFRDEYMYRRTAVNLMAGMTVFIFISAICPNYINLRPLALDTGTICGRLTSIVYASDTGRNVFPSIHVYNTVVLMQAMHMTSSRCGRYAKAVWFTDILGILIILSTVFLKQHSVIDVAGGLILYAAIEYMTKRAETRAQAEALRSKLQYRSVR